MINNVDSMSKNFKCKKTLANYLIYEKHFPLLSVDKKYFYFIRNEETDKILEGIPFWLKLLNIFE
jgi:hypothetical protein